MPKIPSNMAELNGYIEKDLKRKFKLACTAQDRSMSEVLTELISRWLDEQNEPATPKEAQEGK
jgi:hypothetical protein